MKKVLVVLSIAAFVVALASCGQKAAEATVPATDSAKVATVDTAKVDTTVKK